MVFLHCRIDCDLWCLMKPAQAPERRINGRISLRLLWIESSEACGFSLKGSGKQISHILQTHRCVTPYSHSSIHSSSTLMKLQQINKQNAYYSTTEASKVNYQLIAIIYCIYISANCLHCVVQKVYLDTFFWIFDLLAQQHLQVGYWKAIYPPSQSDSFISVPALWISSDFITVHFGWQV